MVRVILGFTIRRGFLYCAIGTVTRAITVTVTLAIVPFAQALVPLHQLYLRVHGHVPYFARDSRCVGLGVSWDGLALWSAPATGLVGFICFAS